MRTVFALTFAGILFSHSALADTLYLHNGDKFTGSIVSTTPGSVEFDAAFGQRLNIPLETVAGLFDSSGQPVPFPAKPEPEPIIIAQPKPLTPATEPIVVAETEEAEEVTEDEPKIFSGRVNLGASLQTGNSESTTINSDAEIKARWNEAHRSTLKAEYNFEDDGSTTTEDNRKIEGIHDYFFTKKWFLNSALSFEQDDIDEIDLRTVASLGLGHQVYESDDLNLQYILGPSYLREDFANGTAENSIAARWAFDYDQKFWDGLIQLFHDHELLVPAKDTDNFLIDSKTGMRVPLKAGLVGTAQVDFDWDNKPEQGVTEDDTEYSLKIGYEW